MKRTLQWVTMFTVAAGMTAMAQQQSASTPGTPSSQSGQTVTVQGCLQTGTGMSGTHTMNTPSTPGTTASRPGSPGSTAPTGSTANPASPGATAQTGQAAGAGQAAAGAAGGPMYTLRVSDASGRTGMPSATAGQSDERSAAANQGTAKVYHLMADASTNLAAHVGHQIEVTGTLSAASGAGATGSGYPAVSGSSGSGSTGAGAAVGTGTPAAGTSQPGTSTSAMGATSSGKAAGVLRVSNVKMIASTCQ
jgi:hypothetical protein